MLTKRPSPAFVVACIALLVALGGTSYAAFNLPKNSVGTKQIKNGAVTGPKINLSTLGTVHSADAANSAAFANNATNANHANSADIANTVPALSWASLTLINGWSAFDNAAYGAPGYAEDVQGVVHLQGIAVANTTGSNDPQTGAVEIDKNGNIVWEQANGANGTFVSLAGVTFPTNG